MKTTPETIYVVWQGQDRIGAATTEKLAQDIIDFEKAEILKNCMSCSRSFEIVPEFLFTKRAQITQHNIIIDLETLKVLSSFQTIKTHLKDPSAAFFIRNCEGESDNCLYNQLHCHGKTEKAAYFIAITFLQGKIAKGKYPEDAIKPNEAILKTAKKDFI